MAELDGSRFLSLSSSSPPSLGSAWLMLGHKCISALTPWRRAVPSPAPRQSPVRDLHKQDGRSLQQCNGGTTRTTAAAMVLGSAMIVAENDPAAEHCSIHVQQAPVGGSGGWHAQCLALLSLAVGEFELNQRIETGKVDLAEAVEILTGLGHRPAKHSAVKKAVSESLKGDWDSSAEAQLRRSADRKKARSDPPARGKIKPCPEVACQRDSVNGSHKKCGLHSCLERLHAEATTPVDRTDVKLLQRVRASRLKRDRVAEKLNWTCPLFDRSVCHICMDAANKQLAADLHSHRRRNSTKCSSPPFGCPPRSFLLPVSLLGFDALMPR